MDRKSAIIAVSGCSSASKWYAFHLQPSKTDREWNRTVSLLHLGEFSRLLKGNLCST
jgi:hypothetical protein